MRNTAVTAVIVIAVTLLIWAGVHNNRKRHEQMQQEQQAKVVLVPGGNSEGLAHSGPDVVDGINLRGKPAPGFSLTSLDGKKISLSDYKGKAVLVNFWATYCAPCKLEMPWLEEFNQKYASQGLVVLGIAADDAGKDDISKVANKTGVKYPILLADNKIEKAYGDISYLPMSFYVGRDGVVVEQTAGITGASSKDEIEANIKKTLATAVAK